MAEDIDVIFVVDPQAWHREFRSWQGVVGRDMIKRTTKGVVLARKTAPSPTTRPRNRTGINYSTGRLQTSIIAGRGRWGRELEGRVFAMAPYAKFVHEGTIRHTIKPKSPFGVLRFFWHKAGRVVYMKRVTHPGTRRTPFLSEHLRTLVKPNVR